MRVIHEIIGCEIAHLSVYERRERILAYIRGRNVAFKDVAAFLEKRAVEEGKVSSASEIPLKREQKLTWVIYMDRFLEWVQREYKSGWIKKEKVKITKVPEGKKGAVSVPKVLSEKRAEKLLESPDNRKAIEEELIKQGTIVIDGGKVSRRLVDTILEDEENERVVIAALRQLGYKIKKVAEAAPRVNHSQVAHA